GFIEGATSVAADLRIPARNALLDSGRNEEQRGIELALRSSLKGLSVELPSPLGKKAEEQRDFQLELPLGDQRGNGELRYGDEMAGRFTLQDGRLLNGALAIGGNLSLQAGQHLIVRAALPRLHLPDWQEALARYQSFREASDAADPSQELAAPT